MSLVRLLAPVLNLLPDPVIRRLGTAIAGSLLKKYAEVEVHGRDILAERAGKATLFVSNHLSNADGILLDRLLKGNQVAFVAGIKLDDNSFTAFFLRTVDYIPIRPNSADHTSIKLAVQRLKNNGSVLIFPEGTRSRTGALIEARRGFTLLAKLAKVPIVPIAIEGSEQMMPINDQDMSREKLKRAHIKMTVGEPFRLPDSKDFGSNSRWEEHCTRDTMQRIAALLSPEYRGVYAQAKAPE